MLGRLPLQLRVQASTGPSEPSIPPSANQTLRTDAGITPKRKVHRLVQGVSSVAALAAVVPSLESMLSGGGGGHGDSGSGFGGRGGGEPSGPGDFGSSGPMEVFEIAASNEKHKKGDPVMITLVSFAVTKMAYVKITRLFTRWYKEKTGVDVVFRLSFGGSGVQARAVIDGLPADIVALALPLDMDKIAQAGLMPLDWAKQFPNNSVVAESTVALVLREGNPKGVKGWEDLTREDIEVICSNPKTAGVARWNFLAMWGHKMAKGDKAALEYCTQVFDRVPVQPRDAREASDVFYRQRKGDVLITYENEVYLTNWMYERGSKGGKALPYILPENNIRVEMPVALVQRNIDKKHPIHREVAEEFVRFLYTPEAQREMARWGFRPVDRAIAREVEAKLPPVKKLWRVDEKLSGWDAAQKKFFDNNKILDQIMNDVGARKLAERIAAARGQTTTSGGRKVAI